MKRHGPLPLLKDATSAAAKHARSDPEMLAWALASYERRHHLTEGGLAAWLELSLPELSEIALCARPDARLVGFNGVVQRIASSTGCHAEHLAQLLQEADRE